MTVRACGWWLVLAGCLVLTACGSTQPMVDEPAEAPADEAPLATAADTLADTGADTLAAEPPPKPLILEVEGRDELRVGEEEHYAVRLAPTAARPVLLRWSMGDGTQASGNYITHRYEQAGIYEVIVTARNDARVDADTMLVTVRAPEPAFVAVIDSVVVDTTGVDVGGAESGRAATGERRPRREPVREGLQGPGGIDWKRGGFTLMTATTFTSKGAEREALRLRRAGYRVGIVLDNSEPGSPVYRVVMGQFDHDNDAVWARRYLIARGVQSNFIVHELPEMTR